MKIVLDKNDTAVAAEIAETYDIDTARLLDMYQEIMARNYHDDLWDIMIENKKELKGE